jgi:hypothetical protein
MKVGLVGTRDRNHAALWPVLSGVIDKLPKDTIVATGCNPHGVDHLVRELAQERGFQLVVFHARWGALGKPAGPERNGNLVAYVDRLIAIPGPASTGTWKAVSLCKEAGKPYTVGHVTALEPHAVVKWTEFEATAAADAQRESFATGNIAVDRASGARATLDAIAQRKGGTTLRRTAKTKVTAAQWRALDNLANGRSIIAGLHGSAAHGGFSATRGSLLMRGWITRYDTITEAGLAALKGSTE